MKQKKKLSDITITPGDQQKVLEALSLITKLVKGLNVALTCPACDHFDGGFCRHYGDIIPEGHYQNGCDNWSDPIPFRNPMKGKEYLV